MRVILITAFIGAACGALGAFIAEHIIGLLSRASTALVGIIGTVVYRTVIGLFVGLAGGFLKKFSGKSYRQPVAGALSSAVVAIIWPVGSTIGGWFLLSISMVIFACSISLAGKLTVRNAIGGLAGGMIAGIVSVFLSWKVGGVVTWAVAGLIIWFAIGIAEMFPLPKKQTSRENEEMKGQENGSGNRKVDG